MNNMGLREVLKFDLYKIFHSTILKAWLYVSCIFCLFMPFVNRVANSSTAGILVTIYSERSYLQYAVLIFGLLLGSTDSYSGYIKNIYSKVNKLYYVLSKIICIALYSLCVYLLYFLLQILFAVVFDGVGFIEPLDNIYKIFGVTDFLFNVFTNIVVLISVGAFAILITTVIKNRMIAVLVALLYVFIFSGIFYEILDAIFTFGQGVTASDFFIVGLSSNVSEKCFFRDIIVSFGWLLFSFITSYIVFKKRSV